jgi:hypothetical protein
MNENGSLPGEMIMAGMIAIIVDQTLTAAQVQTDHYQGHTQHI